MVDFIFESVVVFSGLTMLLFLNELKILVFKNRSDETLENSGGLALLKFVFAVTIIIIDFSGGMDFSVLWPFMLYTFGILALAVFRIKKLKIVIL